LSKPFVVVWEGVDGAGKTTLMNKVKEILIQKGYAVSTYKTPSDSITGKFAKTYGNSLEIDPLTRMLIFLANTSDDSKIIKRNLSEGLDFYFIDRYFLCSIVYGFAFSKTRGAPISEQDLKNFIKIVKKLGKRVLVDPDLYVIVDVPEEERVKRLSIKETQGGLEDSLERDALMQQNVRLFYKAFSEMNPDKVLWIVNREGELEKTSEKIVAELLTRSKKILK